MLSILLYILLYLYRITSQEGVKKIRIFFPTQKKGKELNIKELLACPLFIKEISESIVSAGKSWQLVRHVPELFSMMSEIRRHPDINVPGGSTDDRGFKHLPTDLCSVTLPEIMCFVVTFLDTFDKMSKANQRALLLWCLP